MFNEDSYEQVFSERLSKQSIEVIKNFFVLQPSNLAANKPYSSLMSKPKEYQGLAARKQNKKFTGGFLSSQRNIANIQEKYEPRPPPIYLNSSKVPASEQASFLQGLTTRINMQSQKLLDELNEQKQQPQNEQARNQAQEVDQIFANLNYLHKIRRENRIKYSSLPSTNASNTNSTLNTSELPNIDKRVVSPVKKSCQVEAHKLVPIKHMGSMTPPCSVTIERSGNPESGLERDNFQSSRIFASSFSSKLMKPINSQYYEKGLMFYDPVGKQFIERRSLNIQQQPESKAVLNGITATSYLAVKRNTLQIVLQKNSEQHIEIASLTKIMTCYLTILVCRKYGIDVRHHHVRVSDKAEEMPGTSAELQAGDILTLQELLYGLMLPSGNDASVAIAQAVGKIIQKHKRKPSKKSYYETFLYYMNYLAKQIGLEQVYQNSSGLSLNPNFSSARAITVLTAITLKHPQFSEIVNCKQYSLEVKNERFGLSRKLVWRNTNKLLWKGWEGVKTGTTETAGHCLMSCRGDFIIGVFDCETLGKRFSQCVKIYQQVSML